VISHSHPACYFHKSSPLESYLATVWAILDHFRDLAKNQQDSDRSWWTRWLPKIHKLKNSQSDRKTIQSSLPAGLDLFSFHFLVQLCHGHFFVWCHQTGGLHFMLPEGLQNLKPTTSTTDIVHLLPAGFCIYFTGHSSHSCASMSCSSSPYSVWPHCCCWWNLPTFPNGSIKFESWNLIQTCTLVSSNC